MKVVFLGTPDICIPSLEFLKGSNSISLEHIVSMPDRPAGRGKKLQSPDTIIFAKENNIPFFQTENINEEAAFLEKLKEENIDYFIVFAFAQFLNSKVLAIPRQGCFNIHTSLLPKYRGAAPIQYALINGDQSTGVCIQKMVKKMDAGDIAIKLPVPIEPTDNQTSLYNKLKDLAPRSLNQFFNNEQNDSQTYEVQDEDQVSFAPSFKKPDGELKFREKKTAELINQIRGLVPWPGCFFETTDNRIKVLEAVPVNMKLAPGEISTDNNHLIVGTTDGSIRLTIIQVPGKKACADEQFLKGYRGELKYHD